MKTVKNPTKIKEKVYLLFVKGAARPQWHYYPTKDLVTLEAANQGHVEYWILEADLTWKTKARMPERLLV